MLQLEIPGPGRIGNFPLVVSGTVTLSAAPSSPGLFTQEWSVTEEGGPSGNYGYLPNPYSGMPVMLKLYGGTPVAGSGWSAMWGAIVDLDPASSSYSRLSVAGLGASNVCPFLGQWILGGIRDALALEALPNYSTPIGAGLPQTYNFELTPVYAGLRDIALIVANGLSLPSPSASSYYWVASFNALFNASDLNYVIHLSQAADADATANGLVSVLALNKAAGFPSISDTSFTGTSGTGISIDEESSLTDNVINLCLFRISTNTTTNASPPPIVLDNLSLELRLRS